MFKTIAANNAAALNLTDDQLAVIAAITGKPISLGQAPLIGRYITIDGKRTSEREPKHKDLEIAYEWAMSGDREGELTRIYVGSEVHGPLMSWCEDGWRNCYGKGNHGKNGSHGGNWSSESRRTYPTMAAALADRDYLVTGLSMHRSRMIEGPALLEALAELAATE